MSNLKFKTIGIVGTHRNPLVAETVFQLVELLSQWHVTVLLEADTAEAQEALVESGYGLDEIGKQCDLVIAVGGDGNLLKTARVLSKTDTPVIGINRGHFGYLTDIAPDKLAAVLQPIFNGELIEEKRFLIEGRVLRQGREIGKGNALNDIVLFPGDSTQLIEFELSIDGQFVYSQRSDGLIVATPTGSTAYALSAGGPILAPELDVLLLIPKFPHTLTSRPLVIDGNSQLEVYVGDYNHVTPRLSFDGHAAIDLQQEDMIHITKQSRALRLIHPKTHDYYETLRNKLGWGTQLIPIKRR